MTIKYNADVYYKYWVVDADGILVNMFRTFGGAKRFIKKLEKEEARIKEKL